MERDAAQQADLDLPLQLLLSGRCIVEGANKTLDDFLEVYFGTERVGLVPQRPELIAQKIEIQFGAGMGIDDL